MDITEQNKNTVTSFIQSLFTKGDLGAVDEYLAEHFVDHHPPMGGPANREGLRQADWPAGSELPVAVYAAAARLTRLEDGAVPAPLSATVRLRGRSGQWPSTSSASAAAVSWWPPCSPGRRGSRGRQAGRVSSIARRPVI